MSQDLAEREILERVKPDLEAEGFEVFLAPGPSLLPRFLMALPPDAIAIRHDKKLALEVVRPSEMPSSKLQQLTKLLAGQSDWELRVFQVTATTPASFAVERADTIKACLAEMRQLAAAGHTAPALLLGWATFEAIGRALLPLAFQKAQTPGRLIEVLAGEGSVTPSEAELLRSLAKSRTEFIHGKLEVVLEQRDVERFAAIIEGLLAELPE